MSDFLDRISKLSPKRLALLALELQEKVESLEARAREPVAIVGMACRLPGGAGDPEAFWDLLAAGRDAVGPVPADRWDAQAWFDPDPDAPGRMSVIQGGFLDRIDGFDAAFFGISPREALTLDPQQRLLLEVAWEALEDAGLAPERLAGSAAGVFMGVCNSDHFQRVLARGIDQVDMYLASGNAHSVAAGRISYTLGLNGPAVAVDTACSSSLVALHLACQSVRRGESRLALAGGVNVMCTPETTVALTKGHMLAPDGRCKTFDAAADGFSRGEGCGVLVLKRLCDAVADGDRVLAVIRGTAANQDGKSGGLTVPSGPAQEAVIRAALADAGLAPGDISYVEAHGTGTSLGDPIEVRALAAALGEGHSRQDPLLVGSVKTNLGHLESAAGVTSVMKVVLSLLHERIPPHLHFRDPTPHIPWSEIPVAVEAAGRPWPRGARPRRAGVSSFGFSGTNVHVILEEAPPRDPAVSLSPTGGEGRGEGAERPLHVLPLSARTEGALAALASRWSGALATPGLDLADAAHVAGAGRSHFGERLAVVAADAASAREALSAFAQGAPHPALRRGSSAPGQPPEVAFLFTGQGAQYPEMGALLYRTSPPFREVIDRCDAALGPDAAGRTLTGVLFAPASADPLIHQTAWSHPANFAVEVALAALWRSWGVEPAAVIGHSLGEYAAACVAGVFTAEEGIRFTAERGKLMAALPPGGSMAAIFAPVEEVARAAAPFGDRLALAAINAPDSAVVSGESAAVEALLADFARREVQGHRLYVSWAAHSPLVAPAQAPLEAIARAIPMRAPHVPVAWNLTGGQPLPGGAPDAGYWGRHLREPVRFADGLAALHRDGHRIFLEVGPHPVLVALAQRSLPEQGTVLLGSLRRGKDDWQELLASLADLYVRGVPVDWDGVDRPYRRGRPALPTYPFERRRFWIEPGARGARRARAARGGSPLLGERLGTALPAFETTLTADAAPYLGEHRVQGSVLLAGPVFLEAAQAAAREGLGPAARAVEGFVIHQPLVLPEDGRAVQVQLGAEVDGAVAFSIHGRPAGGEGDWQLHASGRLVALPAQGEARGADQPLAAISAALGPAVDVDAHYRRLAGLGIDLGPSFRPIREARRRDGEALVAIALDPARAGDAVAWVHPCLLDGALQAIGLAVPDAGEGDVHLFTSVERVAPLAPLPPRLWCHARLAGEADAKAVELRADVTLRADDGAVLGELRGVSLRRASRSALARAAGTVPTAFYEVRWEPAPAPAAAVRPALPGPAGLAPALRDRFEALAAATGLDGYDRLLPELDRLSAAHVARALRELGFDATPGRRVDPAAEATRLGVAARHGRLLARLLAILAEDGVLRREGEGFVVAGPLPAQDPEAAADALQARLGAGPELATLRRCGPALARALRGEQDPLQLLFPGGAVDALRGLYFESPSARTFNGALADALAAAVAALPAGARLRVLEIGAGTGGTTSFLLPRLPADQVEYTFTDVSPLFLERAAETFAAHPSLRRALLDVERDPVTQGFEAGAYDVVVAANVLHAAADLRAAVEHARRLLAPGGLLFLVEGTAPERWVDLTFGLTEGWWRFADPALRPAYPLIARDRWVALLSELGFQGATTVPAGPWAGRRAGQQALVVARAPAAPRRFTLVGDEDGLARAVAERLRGRGDEAAIVAAGAAEAAVPPADEVVYLGALPLAELGADDPAGPERARTLACASPLRWLARVARGEVAGRAWLVTRGAQPAGGALSPGGPWQAPLWGAGRVFALEHPGRWGGLVDLAPDDPPAARVDALVASLDARDGEDQTAWRAGARLAARLVPAAPPAAPEVRLRADGTYLVTGGYGGLGLLVARWLAERGARCVALVGRRPQPGSEGVRAVEALGARVIALGGDVADEAALSALLGRFAAEAPPLRGVVHAAADLGVARIEELTPPAVEAMLRPKVDGTVLLERLTRGAPLDFLALFSSTTALLGAAGFAHYAAANVFLDTFAHAAAARGRRVLSVNWGTWEAMRLASAERQRSYQEAGLEPMPAAEALAALGRLLGAGATQATVARVDWGVLRPLHEARRARPFLARLGAAEPSRAAPAAGEPSLPARLAACAPDLRGEVVLEAVRGEVAAVLGVGEASAVAPDAGLFEMGMDSLMSVELKRRLERAAGRTLPSTLTFNYPNARALARFLERELAPAASAAPPAPAAPAPKAAPVPAGDVASLSDDELEARLRARLERNR